MLILEKGDMLMLMLTVFLNAELSWEQELPVFNVQHCLLELAYL